MTELSLHVLDIAKNSTKAGATLIEIEISEDVDSNLLVIEIKDNGCGMDKDFLSKVLDPFKTTRTTRKVGMGLSLFKNACELTGGNLEITSEVGKGTNVKAVFVYDSIDRQPVGDMAATILLLSAVMIKPISYILTDTRQNNLFFLLWKSAKFLAKRLNFRI